MLTLTIFRLQAGGIGVLICDVASPIDDRIQRGLAAIAQSQKVETAAIQAMRTVAGLASIALETIESRDPRGPYTLFATTATRFIAHELAFQIIGSDRQALALIVFHGGSGTQPFPQQESRLAHLKREYHPPVIPVSEHCLRAEDASLVEAVGELIGQRSSTVISATEQCASLVTLQSSRGSGKLFCIPGAGASVVDFIPLATSLGPSCTVHGFQPRGLDGCRIPHTRVEAAALTYLRELQREHPYGDVHLVGHSFGGWIALELALLLQASGRSVQTLTILDSEPPDVEATPYKEYTRNQALIELVKLYEDIAQRSMRIEVADFKAQDEHGQFTLLHSRLVESGLMPSRTRPEVLRGIVTCFESALRSRYVPKATYGGKANLMLARTDRASIRNDLHRDEIQRRWREIVPHVSIHINPGNHMTILKSPNIDSVAQLLRMKL